MENPLFLIFLAILAAGAIWFFIAFLKALLEIVGQVLKASFGILVIASLIYIFDFFKKGVPLDDSIAASIEEHEPSPKSGEPALSVNETPLPKESQVNSTPIRMEINGVMYRLTSKTNISPSTSYKIINIQGDEYILLQE